ncbi:MAG: glycosyltransferase, partial [Deltaproteobacteria bacterium]|nr:glycosyltransferase [Deltaproteobacteria bacterium]
MSKIPDSISIIVPGYNEEKRIYPTLRALSKFCEYCFERFEMVFVDDGSTDHTWEIVKGFPADHLKVIHLHQNRGKGHAVKQGMLLAKGQYRFFTDADLPYDLGCFLQSIEVFKSSRCDIVIGARDLPE